MSCRARGTVGREAEPWHLLSSSLSEVLEEEVQAELEAHGEAEERHIHKQLFNLLQ